MINKAEEIVKNIFSKTGVLFEKGIDKANLLVEKVSVHLKKINLKENTLNFIHSIKEYDYKNLKRDIVNLSVNLKEKIISAIGSDKCMAFVSSMDAKKINFAAVLVMSFFVIAAAGASNLNFGYRVVCNGKTVSIAYNKATAVEAVNDAKKELLNVENSDIGTIKIMFTVANREMFQNPDYTTNSIVAAFDGRETAYGIYADGDLVVPVTSEEEALKLLEEYKNEYRKDNVLEIGFNKKIEILQVRTEKSKVKSGKAAADALRQPAGGVKVHIVSEGETLSEIAEYSGTTTATLMKLNPGVTPETLQIGAQLNVSDTTPAIAILTREKAKITEKIAYETNSVEDKNTYKGITIVVSDGEYGEKEVDYDIYKENGVITKKVAIHENIIKQPITKQVKIGTKKRPASASTGRFINPFAAGVVSSRYGSRSRNYHQGIDLAGATGSPVYAADGGVVTFAGWNGNYGKMIKIRHDNGSETYYAHLSSINVSNGARVAQGSLIGRVGNTGRSTGPHLHFEIRINGKTVNPAPYIGR